MHHLRNIFHFVVACFFSTSSFFSRLYHKLQLLKILLSVFVNLLIIFTDVAGCHCNQLISQCWFRYRWNRLQPLNKRRNRFNVIQCALSWTYVHTQSKLVRIITSFYNIYLSLVYPNERARTLTQFQCSKMLYGRAYYRISLDAERMIQHEFYLFTQIL